MQRVGEPALRERQRPERGELDWLVPFIPPVLRVNRDTRAALRRRLEAALTPEALAAAGHAASSALRAHWRTIGRYALVTALWLRALLWVEQNASEFTTAFVILSGFGMLAWHLFVGTSGPGAEDGMSAYSVFNRGGQRMLGSLSAEQFENEIRHRGQHGAGNDDDGDGRPAPRNQLHDDEEEEDPDLMLALQLSLKEKKREERRQRRTRRR